MRDTYMISNFSSMASISFTIFQFLYSDIYADVLNEVLSNRRKRAYLTWIEHSQVKNQIKRYSEGYSLKYTIWTIQENIAIIRFIIEIKEL